MSNRLLYTENHIELPIPPKANQSLEMDIYVRFMRHMRTVPNSRQEIKILSAIQFTADMTDNSDAHVSKVLVDLGLRAPRLAFPSDFLTHIDQSRLRDTAKYRNLNDSYQHLLNYWQDMGEDRFAYLKRDIPCRETALLLENA